MAVPQPSSKETQLLLDGPALSPPFGIVPNFVDPHNNMIVGKIDMLACLAVTTVAVLIRVYTKLHLMRQFQIADGCIVIGWGLFLARLTMGWVGLSIAPGIHQWDLRLRDLTRYLHITDKALRYHNTAVLYCFGVMLVKVAILVQYLQMFVPRASHTPIFWIIHILIWSNCIFYTLSTLAILFSCSPTSKAWNPLIVNGHCIDIDALYAVTSVLNSISDLVILVLPQISIWHIQIVPKKKWALRLIFMIGFFASASSVMRAVVSIQLTRSDDLSFHSYKLAMWTYSELASGLVVACVPPFPRFLKSLKEMHLNMRFRASVMGLLRHQESIDASLSSVFLRPRSEYPREAGVQDQSDAAPDSADREYLRWCSHLARSVGSTVHLTKPEVHVWQRADEEASIDGQSLFFVVGETTFGFSRSKYLE